MTTRESIHNINIVSRELLPSPEEIMREQPFDESVLEFVRKSRSEVESILDRKDGRLFVVVGPCSIHDIASAKDYATKLKSLSDEVSETLCVLMRVYFEKPRTTVGWKGLINDPDLDDSFNVRKGLVTARQLLIDLAQIRLPAATEALDPISPQYIGDLIAWSAIGARTTESQTHREMASGLSTPVGFKNSTDGKVDVAINALRSVAKQHHFLGMTGNGRTAVFHTRGNRYGHIVLRGGFTPNYSPECVAECERALASAGLPLNIMIDCSHGNSGKDYRRQPEVFRSVIDQVVSGSSSIVGLMLESHIEEGSQNLTEDLSILRYGVSITDACIGWQTTEQLLLDAHKKLLPIVGKRQSA